MNHLSFTQKITTIFFNSLLKADLVSFHTKKDIRNFVELFLKSNQSKDIRFDYGKIAFVDKNNHHCYLRAVPLGSNPEYRKRLSKSIVSTEIKNNFEQVISSGKDVKIITSVSRFEISKGLEYELDIIEKLLQNHPELSEKFVFARYSYISKAKKHSFDYIQQYEKIINRITKINTKYRTNNWHPIHADFTKKLNDYEITSLYRASDILLVASLSDGFNHISIEGPLSKVIEEDRPLQLALGRVGAAEYLTNYSQLSMANPIDDAEILTLLLNMDSEIIIESFKRLDASCKKLSAKIWYTSILYEVINPNAVPQIRINYKEA